MTPKVLHAIENLEKFRIKIRKMSLKLKHYTNTHPYTYLYKFLRKKYISNADDPNKNIMMLIMVLFKNNFARFISVF